MAKSQRTLILEAVETGLKKIKAGSPVPGLSSPAAHRFQSTVKLVSRTLRPAVETDLPALFVVDPVETGRHMLADVLQQTMQVTVAGIVWQRPAGTGSNPAAITALDSLIDDVRALLLSDPTWGGLSRRTRITRLEADTSTDPNSLGFGAAVEIDYIEAVDVSSGSQDLPDPLPVTGLPQGQIVYNALFNSLLTLSGIKWVERAVLWPLPIESVSARFTPGVWFHETNEQIEYQASLDALKRAYATLMVIAVDPDLSTFNATIDTWSARLKECFGTNADFGGKVATVDILAIRSVRSEFPVMILEVDLQIMYVQSFLAS